MKKGLISGLCIVIVATMLALVGCVSGDTYKLITSHDASRGEDIDVRVMSANVLTGKWGNPSVAPRAQMFDKMLEHYAPDVVGVQEWCEDWSSKVAKYNKDYEMVTSHSKNAYDESMTSVIYNTKTVTMIACGTQGFSKHAALSMRYISWGLFEKIDTKEQFVVTSTHWDFQSVKEDGTFDADKEIMRQTQAIETASFVEYLRSTFDVPVFATGDYNCINAEGEEGYEIYELLVSGMGGTKEQVDTKYAVPDSGRLVLGKTDSALYDDPTYRYDHIFITDNIEAKAFNILDDGMRGDEANVDSVYMSISDHAFIYVDAII